MKKFFILTVISFLTLSSCSIDDDNNVDFYLEVLPIESVEIPDEFELGQTYEILISYNRPTGCYDFNDFIYEINGQERTVAVVNTVYTNVNCTEQSELVTVSLNFYVTSNETYLFKFYQGEDEEGEDQYFIVEVPVVTE